ncbi:MAG TPA: M14 metallopeptidase family protein [Pyrinomonadaceae bacterium]|nr:M14 metallopeptidase family protein [Pyrinomonadaceae bacterium]
MKHTLAFALLLLLLTPAHFPSRAAASDTPARPARAGAATVPAPEDVLGFRPGDDRKLASWPQVVEYFRRLDAASPRVKFEELGKTTMGAPFVLATISSPENIERLDTYKDIQRRLADPRTLRGRAGEVRAEGLISNGKAVVLITCGVHSTEVGSYLSGMLIAHRLASSDEPEVRQILDNTIVLLVPSLNPDGVDIVKNWYDKTLGTPYEGTSPPELYHKYVGHDDNRDWYAFTQVETRLTVDKVHNAWRPQIVHDIHQQGAYGSRLFLPPYMKPVEPNVPRQLVEGYTELGRFMADNMLKAGFKGITWDSTYDAWTPARAYSHYHGGVRILSETASVNLATPMTVRPEQLRAGEGYDARKATPNYPVLWPGGEWHLRDITNYMTTAAFELLRHAAQNRTAWLRRFYAIGREAVRPRRPGELQGFKIYPSENSDALAEILSRGGVELNILDEAPPAARRPRRRVSGSSPVIFVGMAQPYGAFAKSVIEAQHYPDLRDAEGHPVPPYDVTAHTLTLLMDVKAEPVYRPTGGRRLGANVNGTPAAIAADPPLVGDATRPPRVALYKSHVPSMDEGWTRWVFEQNRLRYSTLRDAEARAGNLRARYDTIVIPDQSPRSILEGYRKGSMPEELTGGLGKDGVKALREFVEQGGTLVALNDASDFAIEQFGLPVRDVTEGLKRTEFYCPGSILRTTLDTTHPVAKGMGRESIAWVENSPVFEIKSDPLALVRVKIIARYPDSGTPLLSGWLLGGEKIRGKAALVEVGLGRGRIYLFGFRPQYRAQSLATYPLLFNAVRDAGR